MSEHDRLIGQQGGPPRPGGNINDWQAGQNDKSWRDQLERDRRSRRSGGQTMGFWGLVFLVACCYFAYKDITKGRYDSARAPQTPATVNASDRGPVIPRRSVGKPATDGGDAVRTPSASAVNSDQSNETRLEHFFVDNGAAPAWSERVTGVLMSALLRGPGALEKNAALYAKEGDPAQAFIIPLSRDSTHDGEAIYCYSQNGHVALKRSTTEATVRGAIANTADYLVADDNGRPVNLAQAYEQNNKGCGVIFYREWNRIRTPDEK